jgi:flagellar motor switch protein FliM
MVDYTPHTALLALHRLVDDGIEPVVGALGLGYSTETILAVDADDVAALADNGDPQASLLSLDSAPGAPVLLVAEPSLCATVLTAMWGSHRAPGAPLTPVESAMVHQFLSDICDAWRAAWLRAGVAAAPARTMTSSLAMLEPQMVDGTWFVARTVVLDAGGNEVGVLLFAYPAELVPVLVEARRAISWRHRIESGLDDAGRAELAERVRRLGAVQLAAPVSLQTELPLRVLNELERGDVVSIDADAADGQLRFRVLDRTVTGRLARVGDHFALAVTDGGVQRDPMADLAAAMPEQSLAMPEYAGDSSDFLDFDNSSQTF